jgi:hypothetical protein
MRHLLRRISEGAAARVAPAIALAWLAACAATHEPDLSALRPGEQGLAIRAGKVLTVDDRDAIHAPGLVLVRQGKIAYVGAVREIPRGYTLIDQPTAWITPGMVELHSHIHSGSFMDVNDMVLPTNPSCAPRRRCAPPTP